jgi:signal transduction histidine kinase
MTTYNSLNLQHKGNILIIDDTVNNLHLLSSMLEEKGYEVRCANSGKLALKSIKIEHPDLILLDINMPYMNGYEICEKLKMDDETNYIPVIFLSALSESIDKVKAFEIGGVDYITKPFQVAEVLARIENQLKLRRMQRKLEETAEAAFIALEKEKELNRLKSEFTSMISHDFRNPLTSIQGFTGLLELSNENLSEETIKYYTNKINQAVDKLLLLLDDILLIGSMETRKISYTPRKINLHNFCQELITNLQLGIGSQHQILYSCSVQYIQVELDVMLLDSILNNLLTNAIKYSPSGTEINFDVEYKKNHIVFCIKDNGIGIPVANYNNLFQPFYRCNNVGKIKGTGLGLAIVKRCVEAHKGNIYWQSEEGKGTTFTVAIPIENAKP